MLNNDLQLVMSLRAPRRRISPRTKRRYRAFRNFLKRALGTSSQPDDKTNSNISVSVSDLKHKIVGIEKQLDQVSQHCRNLITGNDDSTCEKSITTRQNSENCISLEKNVLRLKPTETKLLYKTSENQLKNFVASDVTSKVYDVYCVDVGKQRKRNNKETKINSKEITFKRKIRKSNDELSAVKQNHPYLNRLNRSWAYETDKLSASAASFCSMVEKTDYSLHRNEKRQQKKDYNKPVVIKKLDKMKGQDKNNIQHLLQKCEESNERNSYRKEKKGLDKEFITDIIRKQYQPVKLFNRKDSALSQLSAPLCRDKDISIHENIQEGSELCSCCYDDLAINDQAAKSCSISDVRSVYDTKLYNAKRYTRSKQSRNNQEYYNDSYYDLVPVKEKSSPKTRKKFTEDNTIPYDHYKEVPPSPRSLRPRLNLKAQNYGGSDNLSPYMAQSHKNDGGKVQKIDKNIQNNDISNVKVIGINNNDEDGNYSNILVDHNKINILNDDLAPCDTGDKNIKVDKTDKALYEIKDILQNFLEEIKKETTLSDKSEESIGTVDKRKRHDENTKNVTDRNSLHSCRHSNISAQCTAPCINPFPSNYCYPILPVCPMPCVQSGYPPVVLPNHSNTCTACTSHRKEFAVQTRYEQSVCDETNHKNTGDDTQQLIKKIYNCVKQNTPLKQNMKCQDVCSGPEPMSARNKELTSRSAGASSNPSFHDIVIGTSETNYHSKSCEAFDLKKGDDTSFIDGRYSDTVLEKLSLEAAATQPSEFDFSSILDVQVKPTKKKKFFKLLKTFGSLLKNKKNNVIKELSESHGRSTEDEDSRPPSPYRQYVTNYMMHGEEYYRQPPPLLPRRIYPPMTPEYSYRQPIGIDSRYGHPHLPLKHPYNSYSRMTQDQTLQYTTPYDATSPSYVTTLDPRYNPAQSQVPVCLKEVEVKSSGTQSEKKVSFLEVLKEKLAGPKPTINPVEEAEHKVEQMTKKTGMLNWKKWQEKTIQQNKGQLNYTQKNFTETDMTVRDVLITRMFKRRNPFSARNPLLQTLLGKDKPMKEPSNLLRPRIIV